MIHMLIIPCEKNAQIKQASTKLSPNNNDFTNFNDMQNNNKSTIRKIFSKNS